MLKKIIISTFTVLFLLSSNLTLAAQKETINDGETYSTLNRTPADDEKNEVIEFLSFTCGACYMLETQGGYEIIKNSLPENVKLTRYVTPNNTPISPYLNESWAIANVLGVDKAFAEQVFKGFFETRSLQPTSTEDDLIKIFERLNVSKDQYMAAKNHPQVKAFIARQDEKTQSLRPEFTPAFYINGKYVVNPNGLDQDSIGAFFTDYARVISHLLQK